MTFGRPGSWLELVLCLRRISKPTSSLLKAQTCARPRVACGSGARCKALACSCWCARRFSRAAWRQQQQTWTSRPRLSQTMATAHRSHCRPALPHPRALACGGGKSFRTAGGTAPACTGWNGQESSATYNIHHTCHGGWNAQEVVNLLLVGRAVSNCFDGTHRLDADTVLKGT